MITAKHPAECCGRVPNHHTPATKEEKEKGRVYLSSGPEKETVTLMSRA
jgi:hypothetical protein